RPPTSVFARREFLDSALCRELRGQAAQGRQGPAYLSGAGGTDLVDESRRRTRCVLVADSAQQLIEQRLLAIIPEVRSHFAVDIGPMQQPQFLRYRRGDFFRAHQDSSRSPEIVASVQRRRVSAIVFLNRQTRLPPGSAIVRVCRIMRRSQKFPLAMTS